MGKTPEEIRDEIKAARDQMADGVRGLSSQIHPSVVRQRAVQSVKDGVVKKLNDVKALVVDDSGIRWDHIGTVALAAAGMILVGKGVSCLVRLFHRR